MKKGLYIFYFMFALILGFTIYISGVCKKEKVTTFFSRIKRFGDENRYVVHVTKNYKVKLSKIVHKNGMIILENE